MGATAWDPSKKLWEVVGGAQKGGILARTGESTSSQECDERLSHGAWVQQEQLNGQRLLYTLLVGSGPKSGWVSLKLNQQDLLVSRRGPPPGMERREEPPVASSSHLLSAPEGGSAAGLVLQQQEVLASILGHLRLPWAGVAVAPVCRAWRSFLGTSAPAWAKITLGGQREVPSLSKLLQRAGPRLRVLDLSKVVGRKLGPMPELSAALRSCSDLEDLNVSGWDKLSFARSPDVPTALSRSLKRLNIRGCSALHAQLPSMLGNKLQVLEAGWKSEGDPDRVWKEWVTIFPPQLWRTIAGRCPNLARIRFPGYALYSGQPESVVQKLLREYGDIGGLGSLRQLQRLDLSCAQLLEDPAIEKIARGCKRLRSLGLRNCENITDRGLQAIADNLGNSLAHVNISCCMFAERTVRRLVLRCRGLKTLDVCYCRGIGRDFMRYLCNDPALCPQLVMLGAGGMDVSDAEIDAMCKKYAGTLEHLGIGSAEITDAGLRMLAELPHLRRLSAHMLKRVSARGMMDMCYRSTSLQDVDADQCEYTPEPSPKELEALKKCLEERVYDYDLCDEESDSEEAEKERLKKEREEKERKERERRKKEKAEKEQQSHNLLEAMGKEMENLF